MPIFTKQMQYKSKNVPQVLNCVTSKSCLLHYTCTVYKIEKIIFLLNDFLVLLIITSNNVWLDNILLNSWDKEIYIQMYIHVYRHQIEWSQRGFLISSITIICCSELDKTHSFYEVLLVVFRYKKCIIINCYSFNLHRSESIWLKLDL